MLLGKARCLPLYYELNYSVKRLCVFFLMKIAIAYVATIKVATTNNGVISGIVGDGAGEDDLDEPPKA